MNAIHVGGVVVSLGQGLEEVGAGQHGGHGARRVTDEDHRSLGGNRTVTAREGLVRKVVLQRVNQAALHALASREFVESDTSQYPTRPMRRVALLTKSFASVTSPPDTRMPWGENSE